MQNDAKITVIINRKELIKKIKYRIRIDNFKIRVEFVGPDFLELKSIDVVILLYGETK